MDEVMIAAYERKIRELEEEVYELLDREDGYRLRIADLSIINRDLRTPCQCDPPGSGELCNRYCRVRARMLAQLGPPDRARAMIAFDNSVAEVIALGRADEAS